MDLSYIDIYKPCGSIETIIEIHISHSYEPYYTLSHWYIILHSMAMGQNPGTEKPKNIAGCSATLNMLFAAISINRGYQLDISWFINPMNTNEYYSSLRII